MGLEITFSNILSLVELTACCLWAGYLGHQHRAGLPAYFLLMMGCGGLVYSIALLVAGHG